MDILDSDDIDVDLTKWPRLVIAGDPITEDQASEVILRTTDWYTITGNDPDWAWQVAEVVGLQLGDHGWPLHDSILALRERIKGLPLDYMANHRIASAWIGGPHGWCSWDGVIGTSEYNVGKYPTWDEVNRELDLIAATFPFLRFSCWLIPNEGEGHGRDNQPACQWEVVYGEAHPVSPSPIPFGLDEMDATRMFRRLSNPTAERGVSIERLRDAWAQVTS